MHTRPSASASASRLVVVPCGRSKIWDKHPSAGPTVAQDAYTGTPFKLNRRYAEAFGDAWVILSAKYGFITPDFVLPGPYEVTFKRKSSNPVSTDALRLQVVNQRLSDFANVRATANRKLTKRFRSCDSRVSSRCRLTFFASCSAVNSAARC